MSEFKFACPVCGQHITAESNSSGKELECPTCFRKIVIPPAPASAKSKFILSAAQASKPRPAGFDSSSNLGASRRSPTRAALVSTGILLAILACAAAVAYYFLGDKVFGRTRAGLDSNSKLDEVADPREVYPIPTNTWWTLEFASARVPDATAAGSIHGRGFKCERAILQGGNLSLRQGTGWGVNIVFFAKKGEELSGKTVEILPDRSPPLPKVTVRWKNSQNKGASEKFENGYALRVVFGRAANKRISGQLYLALPDETKSFIAGTFEAEIKPPAAPKPHKRK